MSRQIRRRMTVIVLGGLVVGAPMLAISSAGAQPVRERTRAVTFSHSGVLGLSCNSRPSMEAMTVPARSTIRVVNETGHAAQLMLGDDPQVTLQDDASADVIVRRGTTAVTLKPTCATDDLAAPVMITASPTSPRATPSRPAPAGTTADAASTMLAPTGPDASPSRNHGAATQRPPAEPSHSADVHRRSVHHSPAPSHSAVAEPQAIPLSSTSSRARVKTKVKSVPRTSGSAAPAFAGMPPGDSQVLLPGVHQLEPEPVDTGPTTSPSTPTPVAEARPVTLDPMREGGPLGLLALTAAVCVAGVTIAAIRSIVSQRANRAEIA